MGQAVQAPGEMLQVQLPDEALPQNGGNGGAGVNGSNNGRTGNNYGGGGSGAVTNSGTDRTGGSGADGYVVIIWTVPYFSQNSGDPSVLSNWNSDPAGSGSSPAIFTSDNQAFIIQTGHDMITAAAWSVSGANTKVGISSNASLTANNQITLSPATIFQIDDGGTYIHNNASSSVSGGQRSFRQCLNRKLQFFGSPDRRTGHLWQSHSVRVRDKVTGRCNNQWNTFYGRYCNCFRHSIILRNCYIKIYGSGRTKHRL